MKNITPQDTRYIPFTQQKFCCVPASISIVMYKLGIPLVPQELLGYYLGLTIPKEFEDLFYNLKAGNKPESGYGTRIHLSEYSPNNAFKKLEIPLEMSVYFIDDFQDKQEFIDFVSDYIKQDKDILVCFDNATLNNDNENYGHVCVIDKIYSEQDIIRIIDPSSRRAKWREVNIDILIKAMQEHPSKRGGFWELKKK